MLVSSGLMVNLHYCGDYLSELAVFLDADGCCCPAEKEMKNDGCCSDESVYVAFDADQLHQEFDSIKLLVGISIEPSINHSFSEIPVSMDVPVNTANAPPLLNEKIYLQLSRLKVFGDC